MSRAWKIGENWPDKPEPQPSAPKRPWVHTDALLLRVDTLLARNDVVMRINMPPARRRQVLQALKEEAA